MAGSHLRKGDDITSTGSRIELIGADLSLRVAALPRWAVVLGIYGASRVVSSGLLAIVFATATAQNWDFASFRANPNFFTFSSSWDSSAYRIIAEKGYPSELPLTDDGHVASNVWAFMPLYPWLVNLLASTFSVDYYVVGVFVSTIFGAIAVLGLFVLTKGIGGEPSALWAVALFSFGPLSFLLQVSYAESMFLALVFWALVFAVRRQYWLVGLLGVVACFTRPGALAIALALGLLFVVRWRSRSDPFPWTERLWIIAAGAAISVAGLSWSFIAAAVTGQSDAYFQSELAYWAPLVDRHPFVPFSPWFLLASTYLNWFGVALVVAIAGAVTFYLMRRPQRFLPLEARLHAYSYVLYVFAVFLPQQSIFRIALPLAPLLADPKLRPASALARGFVLAGCVVLQLVAIVLLWFLSFP